MGFTVVTVGLHSEPSELASRLTVGLVGLPSEPTSEPASGPASGLIGLQTEPTFAPSSLAYQLAQRLEAQRLWV